ncbi:MAG: CocE/NonD family hydrolase [Steroidobacteraceae bacterium]|nr:CocE/NonD family hydrolase [Nevskiaceae bacterium]MCP5472504.1 CocE/NonD family hydrolase [Nevskiaceae bacterium]
MTDDLEAFVPALPYDETQEHCCFSRFDPGTRILPVGFRAHPRFAPLPIEIVLDKDVAVTLRDGVTIYVDVLRPKTTTKVPVIVAWSPYGKSRGHDKRYVELLGLLGMDLSTLSGLMKFEGPDPAYWCAQGYAVCHPDPRGAFDSEGDIRIWSRKEGQDYHDLIEWLGVRDWCNGAVGLTGNSYLAISQWFAAAERPPHLAAIAPWEGMSDIYRDLVARGGIPDFPFPQRLCGNLTGKNLREDFVVEAEQHPLVDALWESKIPAFERIDVPAYVVGSYSNSIHTPGTFRGWRRIASAEKWLRIHNTMEWPDYYETPNVDDLRRFFDRYLKGVDNGWEATPRVRYALMDLEGGDRVNLPAAAFPPEDAVATRLYLDAGTGTLCLGSPPAAVASYDATSESDLAVFTIRVQSPTAFVGYPKLRLWVEAEGHDDMDLFVFLEKLDAEGKRLEQFNVPNHGPQMQALTRNGAAILKYKGSNGRLRVSRRHLDPVLTTDAIPAHSFDREEKLAPGQVVDVEIDLFPTGLALYPGEQLRLVVSGHHEWGGAMPGIENVKPDNHGRHVIHTGGARASFLQLPMKPLGS